jgi:hypothetical protein
MRSIPTLFVAPFVAADDKPKPIEPDEALKKVGKNVTVEMEVKSVGTIRPDNWVLNSKPRYTDPGNFQILISGIAVAEFKKLKADDDPCEHFRKKVVRVTGKVELLAQGFTPWIVVDHRELIEIVKMK